MSLDALAWAIEVEGVPALKRLVLLRIANHVDQEHFTGFPSVRHIATALEIGESTVRGHIGWLVRHGYLVRTTRHRADGGQSSNLYKLPVPPRDKTAPRQKAEGGHQIPEAPPADARGTPTENGRGGHQMPEGAGPDAGGQEPVIEPVSGPESHCSEPQAAAEPPAVAAGEPSEEFSVESPNHPNPIRPKGDDSPVFILIPMVASAGRPMAITEGLVAEWVEAYPGLDVRQTLRNIRQWNLSTPNRRKTPSGIKKHVTDWLSREQNKGGRRDPTVPSGGQPVRAGHQVNPDSALYQ